ncbi:hypothetical protein HKX48_008070, partial [Thoreauomyces humboldtii]
LALFDRLTSEPEIPISHDYEAFRQLCYRGIPDNPHTRPACWKLLLQYLPYDARAEWTSTLRSRRGLYYTFVKELIKDPGIEEGNVEPPAQGDEAARAQWQTWRDELAILEQIDKDVRRTLPDLAFFQLPIPTSAYSPLNTDSSHDATMPSPTAASSDDTAPTRPAVQPFSPIQSRRALFKRLDHLNGVDFGARSRDSEDVAPVAPVDNDLSTPPLPPSSSPDPSQPVLEIPEKPATETRDLHWEAIERVLFIYAKLNPGIGYVQGMNEILGPLYYVFANDSDEESRAHAEADSFFCFTTLLSEFRDHFVRSLDNVREGKVGRSASLGSLNVDTDAGTSASALGSVGRKGSMGEVDMEKSSGNGIGNSMARLMKRLRRRDPELWTDFQRKGIHAAFFSFRWLTCLLTQEFALPEVIQLWDAILSDLAVDIGAPPSLSPTNENGETTLSVSPDGYLREGRFDFLIDVCCAMLICIREELLAGSFADCVRMLQHYPITDVSVILAQAFEFREARKAAAATASLNAGSGLGSSSNVSSVQSQGSTNPLVKMIGSEGEQQLAAMGDTIKDGLSGFMSRVRSVTAPREPVQQINSTSATPASDATPPSTRQPTVETVRRGWGSFRDKLASSTAAAVSKMTVVTSSTTSSGTATKAGTPPVTKPRKKVGVPHVAEVMWIRPESDEDIVVGEVVGDAEDVIGDVEDAIGAPVASVNANTEETASGNGDGPDALAGIKAVDGLPALPPLPTRETVEARAVS